MAKSEFSKRDNYSRCLNSAIYSLAMREHSRQEIYNKLRRKAFSEDVDLEKLLDELEQNNYLNEQRFAESFVRSRILRGQGPHKIASDLRRRGIAGSKITAAMKAVMQENDFNWRSLAIEQLEKKYGAAKVFAGEAGEAENGAESSNAAMDSKEKARRMRFLASRGFDGEVIRAVVD